MIPKQKRILTLLLVMAAAVFVLFAIPNALASDNISMVQMFEPDEAAPLPYMLKMIAPAPSIGQALRGFMFYEYYYYGFPYFSLSALTVLPLQWLGRLGDMPLVMLVLRQLITVLPMLIALLLLVYLQDGFHTYRSPVLFAFLLTVPAVVNNNFWWHPDGITFLWVMLTLFFLHRDNLRFGRNFLLAAVFSGVAAATKLVGVYFFLAVGLTLLLGLVLKKTALKKLVLMALAYLGVMALSFVAANPFLLSGWARTAYMNTFAKQTDLLAQGYGIQYAKGLEAAWPVMHQFYGEALFLLAALGVAVWSMFRGKQRLLMALIVAWFIPVSVSILVFTHFKYQYWLPVALPLFSCLVVLLPEKWAFKPLLSRARWLQTALLVVALVQGGLYIGSDIQDYTHRVQRAENNTRIQFYTQAVNALIPLPPTTLHVYYDYRLYVPETPNWYTDTNYEMLDYPYIQQGKFHVLLLLEQRIRDYLNPNATGIDAETFARAQTFYRDAQSATLKGYRQVYQDAVGSVFVEEALYRQYYTAP